MAKLGLGLVLAVVVVCTLLGQSEARSRRHRGRRVPESSDGYVDLDEFLRYYCRGARGNYERCQRCIAVACVRELDNSYQTRKYQSCIDGHSRCCTDSGVHPENVMYGSECFGTGVYDAVVTGELSIIESIIGSQRGPRDLDVRTTN